MKKILIIVAGIIILLGIGAYFLFSNGNNNSSSNQQYQTSTVSGNLNNSSISQADAKYSGLDLTPEQPQTDVVPSASTDIPSP